MTYEPPIISNPYNGPVKESNETKSLSDLIRDPYLNGKRVPDDIIESLKTLPPPPPEAIEKFKKEQELKKLEEKKPPKKIILQCHLSPGDILMLTAAVRDLHLAHPKKFLTDVRTTCKEIWENNPYITKLDDNDPEVQKIQMHYPLINKSNTTPYHFIHGYRMFLEEQLKISIPATTMKGDIHLSENEKKWISQVHEITGEDTPFWIVVSGGKYDFTAKWWDHNRMQEVVNRLNDKVVFVQCGEKGHHHPKLEGVIDLIGKTDLRQIIRLMYHAKGVICPVTFFMHLAAAVPTKPGYPLNKPAVVIAGGREPSQWEAYPHHAFLHTNGALKCCDNGGCWKSRVVKLNDGDKKDESLCIFPTQTENGVTIPKCLEMITVDDVVNSVNKFLYWDTM
jgi:ADP-heptose:LPS heptosyltransferase